jgi:hypothetical protein
MMRTVLPTPRRRRGPSCPLHVRLEQIDDLDARFEHLDLRGLLLEGGASRWIGQRSLDLDRPELVDRLADDVDDAAQRGHADRHVIASPVSSARIPRTMPSVGSMATVRTRFSPRCC